LRKLEDNIFSGQVLVHSREGSELIFEVVLILTIKEAVVFKEDKRISKELVSAMRGVTEKSKEMHTP